ncbi:xanthine phosphoribosyltransferase [Lactobacillus sp. S2-2]|uniref:xanthine phosphoribosyltransferase n=1 Tax=Lactobacillus sp. S2-2 TaxID=2692917 RepID=UPI001F0253CD|nr:xanthine phosphoribosyltransferase [Lactobacillus sp. S2-2]MCF6514759.1 xanthine phosphoribosyltransferase [Lactobacillus sp. S2-2]
MKLLEDRIKQDGKIISDDILKVNSFLNHQIDPNLMNEIGKEFARKFKDKNITRIITVETSGIAPALTTGLALNVPVVFARKNKSATLNEPMYEADVFSFTKTANNKISIDKNFIDQDDNILIIDDFLANGEATKGVIKIVNEAKANISGIGIVIEKSFQPGRKWLNDNGYEVESLARIKSLENGKCTFMEND